MGTTLTSVFEAHKVSLSNKLKGYSLPRDSKQVEETVTEFLQLMFENDSDYRQGLTQSEDYILQSAIQLLRAQQSIASEIVSVASTFNANPNRVLGPQPTGNPYMTLAGTGIGALAGGVLGTWGAICGAIAGTAISVYLKTTKKNEIPADQTAPETPINVNAFISIVQKICESIDDLMETYRVQVKRIESSFTNIQEESPLTTYSHLFAQIENLHDVIETEKEHLPEEVVQAENAITRSLRNYGLAMEDGKIVSLKN